MPKIKILAIDPGVTSGYCFAEMERKDPGSMDFTNINLRPEQHIDDVEDCWDRIEEFAPRYIICEDFEYRNKSRSGLVLFSVQLIGVVSLYELKSQQQCAVYLQPASQGKSYYSNVLLKKLGVYKPGTAWEHSMDATRHLLHWLTFGAGYQYTQGHDIKDLVKLV